MTAEAFRSIAGQLVAAWRETPEPAIMTCKTETSEILRQFRPYVEEVLTGNAVLAPKVVRDNEDRRERLWHVSLELWTGTPGHIDTLVAQSDGRRKDAITGAIATYGGEVFKGLGAVANYISEGAVGCEAPAEDFSYQTMFKALGYLRPSFTKGKGHATMRRTSADGRWHLICDVFKEGAFPDGHLSRQNVGA